MGFLDIVLGCLLLFAIYNGLKKGLFVELASFVSLIIGIFVAIKFSGFLKNVLLQNTSWSPKYVAVVAFALTFIIVVAGIHLLAKVFTGIASFAYLGWLNKFAGACFSVLKTVLALSIVIGLFQKINVNNYIASKKTLDNSIFYNPIREIANFVFPSLEKLYYDGVEKVKTINKTD
jgi:membrane protein required for colicin V production